MLFCLVTCIFYFLTSCVRVFLNLVRYYGDVLCALSPLFGEQESDDAVRDNACGAVARMLMAQPKFIPLSQVRINLSVYGVI